ncbi:MAG: transposase, partial [Deltaproteobacteria bacterium]|nr:transposase [Deltaproteobacteria bacterium]
MPVSLQKRLRGTWASVFKREILPVLMGCEEQFAILYGEKGRPNFSTGRMLGLCLLQEFNNLSDQAALDAFGFDVRWQFPWLSHYAAHQQALKGSIKIHLRLCHFELVKPGIDSG